MVRQKDNRACYRITCDNHYLVIIVFLGFNYTGIKRYEATLINLDKTDDYSGAHVYRFTGHNYNEYEECRWIAEYHEKKARKMRCEQ